MSGLAEALRALLAVTDSTERDPHSGAVVGVNAEVAAAETAARAALAAHDAAVAAGGWIVEDDAWPRVVSGDGKSVIAKTYTRDGAHAARIVACVNACTGIADPAALVRAAQAAERAG